MIDLETFKTGSVTHGLVILTSAAALFALVWCSRTLGKNDRSKSGSFRKWLGMVILVFQALHVMYWLVWRQEGFDWKQSLPVHICDVAGFMIAAALLYPARLLVAAVYFWGVGLSLLAFIIPVLTEGPGYLVFWTFWVSHFMIVAGALFFVLAEGFRPTGKDYLLALLFSSVYAVVVISINAKLDSNYAYLGRESPPTEFFGPWPMRVPLLLAAGALLQFLAWVPFLVFGRQRTPEPDPS